jgi:hypothetical protein
VDPVGELRSRLDFGFFRGTCFSLSRRAQLALFLRLRGGLRSGRERQNAPGASFARLDKLKHVPQCAARKLTVVSSQRSAFEFSR